MAKVLSYSTYCHGSGTENKSPQNVHAQIPRFALDMEMAQVEEGRVGVVARLGHSVRNLIAA